MTSSAVPNTGITGPTARHNPRLALLMVAFIVVVGGLMHLAAPTHPAIAGTWQEVSDTGLSFSHVLTFTDDHKFRYPEGTLMATTTYTLPDASHVAIAFSPGVTFTIAYSVSGDTLTLSMNGANEIYHRVAGA